MKAPPVVWPSKRLRYVAEVNPGKLQTAGLADDTMVSFLPMEKVDANGDIDLSEEREASQVKSGYTSFIDGDVIVAKITPCFENGKGAVVRGLKHGIGFGSTEFHVIRPSEALDARFLYYVTSNRKFRQTGAADMRGAAGQQRVTTDFIKDYRTTIPPITQQGRIADWLDAKTKEIDEVSQRKSQVVERLETLRDGLVAQAVSGDDQPRARVATGNPFLPNMPAHWKLAPLKRHWQVIDCKHKTVEFHDDGVPLASIGEVHGLEVDLTNAKRTTLEEATELREGGRYPQPSDIIYSRNATVGDAAMVMPGQDLSMGQDVCLIRGATKSQRYLQHQLHSRFILGQLDMLMVGATFKRINVGDIKSFAVFIPPVEEMPRIASLCDTIHGDFTTKIRVERESCKKLALYRQSLITAAVTGQLSIP